MTENLAGRGEGLAGLVAKWRDNCGVSRDTFRTEHNTESYEYHRGAYEAFDRVLGALEATVSPASHTLIQQAIVIHGHVDLTEKGSRPLDCEVCKRIAAALEAAAPASTGFVVSGEPLSEAESRWLKASAAALATPSPQSPELSRHTCDWCGQDLRGAGFDGHYNIYCHKPECAAHLIIPTCDCDPEYPHHCVPAATKEPAGSGAKLPQWTDEQIERIKSTGCTDAAMAMFEKVKLDGGSPRKVGEDGQPEKYERTHSRVWANAWNEALEKVCELVAVNGDKLEFGPFSIGHNPKRVQQEHTMIVELIRALRLRPSSVPVGEQKQEEGV